MSRQDLSRRISIVRALSTTIVGLIIAYLIPHVIGFVMKLQSTNPDITPWGAAMDCMPIRIVHIFGVAIAALSMLYAFVIWARRFTEPREGEAV